MKFNKETLLIPVIIVLLMIPLFSQKIIDVIPSNKIIFVAIIVYLLGFFIFVFLTYRDITRKKYTTTTYVVLIDISVSVYFIVVLHAIFANYNETDILALAERNLNISKANLFFLIVVWARSLLTCKKFRKGEN